MNEQTPSIGRLVRYHDTDGNVVPAVISGIGRDGAVDLHVLHATHGRVPKRAEDGDAGNSWAWPEFVPPARDPQRDQELDDLTRRVRALEDRPVSAAERPEPEQPANVTGAPDNSASS